MNLSIVIELTRKAFSILVSEYINSEESERRLYILYLSFLGEIITSKSKIYADGIVNYSFDSVIIVYIVPLIGV